MNAPTLGLLLAILLAPADGPTPAEALHCTRGDAVDFTVDELLLSKTAK